MARREGFEPPTARSVFLYCPSLRVLPVPWRHCSSCSTAMSPVRVGLLSLPVTSVLVAMWLQIQAGVARHGCLVTRRSSDCRRERSCEVPPTISICWRILACPRWWRPICPLSRSTLTGQGLCCVLPSCGRLKPQSHSVSDRLGKLVKCDRQPPGRWLLDRQLVVPSTNVLDEGMSRDDHPGAAVSLEASHRPQPGLEASVIGLDVVVGIPLSAMPRRWQQLLQYHRIRRCPVG
jgi:hypothetical protein